MKKTAVLLLFWVAAALSAQNAIPSQGVLRFQSGPYSLILSAPSAFTPSVLNFEGTELLAKSGANGTILSFPGGKMLGASAATEKVEKLFLTVDGKEQEVRENGQYAGKRIVLEKESVIGGYRFFSSYILTPDGLDLPIRYRSENDQKPSYFYLFAMGFSPLFSEYLTPAGQGSFQSDGGWGPNSDFPWAALYMKSAGTGVVLSFPRKIPLVSRKNTFWDHKTYRKFYLFHAIPEFKPDKESPVYQMNIRAFKAPENKWPDTAKEIAGKMNALTNDSTAPKVPERKLNPTPIPDFGDTSKEDWKTNRRGIEALSPDFVLPPFENVQADSNGAKVWNRRYDLDGSGLLSKVLIGNEAFFSRPMSMDMTVNGQKVTFRPSGSQMLMNKKGRAVFERTLTSPDLDLKTVTAIEFDGMVRVDMTLIPKKKLSLDRFSYAFHLPRKNALFTHFIGAPNSHISIMIPKESFSMPVPKENGEFFREPFKSLVWFGNHDKGFLWFCGSERNWSPQDQSLRPSALTASATDREVSFQTVPVSAPYVIQSPVTYTFGFFATPVRPMPEGWRDWFCSTRRGIYDSETRHGKVGTLPMIWPDEYREVSAYPRIRKNADKVKQWAQELHDSGRPALTYCDPIRVGIGYLKYLDAPPKGQQLNDLYLAKDNAAEDVFLYRTPELAENMKNWQTLPELIYNYGAAHGGLEVRVSSASGWADFFCFLVEKMAIMGFDGFGDIDNCFPIRDMNEAHGAGYVDQNGVRRYEWDWFARRDLMKRIAAIFLKTRGKPGILVAHSSATWSIPFISFCDANMTFEHSNSGYFSNPTFLSKYGKHNPEITEDMKNGGKLFLRYAFPKERWQAELTGAQFGLPCIVMSNLTKSPQVDKEYAKSKRAARELGAFVAAHDCLLWPIWCNTAPLIRLIEIRKEFGLGNKDVEFFPYWSDANPVKSSNPAISVTTYRRPGKLLLNICNLTDNEAEASLEFGTLVPVQILNQETGKNRILEQGKLKVKVDGRDYRIYTVVLK